MEYEALTWYKESIPLLFGIYFYASSWRRVWSLWYFAWKDQWKLFSHRQVFALQTRRSRSPNCNKVEVLLDNAEMWEPLLVTAKEDLVKCVHVSNTASTRTTKVVWLPPTLCELHQNTAIKYHFDIYFPRE